MSTIHNCSILLFVLVFLPTVTSAQNNSIFLDQERISALGKLTRKGIPLLKDLSPKARDIIINPNVSVLLFKEDGSCIYGLKNTFSGMETWSGTTARDYNIILNKVFTNTLFLECIDGYIMLAAFDQEDRMDRLTKNLKNIDKNHPAIDTYAKVLSKLSKEERLQLLEDESVWPSFNLVSKAIIPISDDNQQPNSNYTFKIIAKKGQSFVLRKSGMLEKINAGTILYKEDILKMGDNAYLGAMSTSGKTFELKGHAHIDLDKIFIPSQTGVVGKYSDFINIKGKN